MAWTEDKKALVASEYSDIMANNYATDEERANATVEIVAELAEKHGEAPNGVRTILNRANVYIKKVAAPKAAATTAAGGTKRVNKAEAIKALTDVIELSGGTADDEILSKLTGKAALYFTGILQPLIPASE